MEHRLVNDTLEGTDRGIIARCTCGWTSGYRFSSFIASAAFSDHKDVQQSLVAYCAGLKTMPPIDRALASPIVAKRSGEGDKVE